MPTYYIVSGGFDPIHEGHISLIKDALSKSDGVLVIVNSDDWLIRKKGKVFQNFYTRKTILENIKGVIYVTGCNDDDNSVNDGIRLLREKYPDDELVFANGGDRNKGNIREDAACEKYNVKKAFSIGGSDKMNSSSWILENYKNTN